MRAKIAATSGDTEAETVIASLCELAEQEFGLTGVAFNEVMAKVDECFDFEPTAYASGIDSPRETRNAAGTNNGSCKTCLLYTSPSPRDGLLSRMPSSA